ncbi:hypothetical protein C3408_05685 [Candidatus Pantoea alvi]|nr:hypothetical protein C3408_05685 [Pantoea alvi]
METENNHDENIIKLSQNLQEHFGFKTAQWAKILKVERKTIYNWKTNSNTKVRQETAIRISELSEFAKFFKREHSLLFAKFIFGAKADKKLSSILHQNTLKVDELTDAYYNIYTQIDGAVKRKKILG